MRHALMLTAALYPLTACGYFAKPAPASLQANLLAPCPDLADTDVGDMGDLLNVCVDTAVQYRQCQARHNALVESLK